MDIREKMHSGELYFPGDEELVKEQLGYLEKLYDFNQIRPNEQEKRAHMLKEMFAEVGEKTVTLSLPFTAISAGGMSTLERTFMPISI